MLLTRQALALVRRADVVAYDDLVHPSLLLLARPDAELIPVGYRGLRDHAMTHAVLAPEVIAAAREGRMVVRLKTGDPLVLGRGGEEGLLLRELGIPFTIVPGITAALGAAAAVGIPLTHRNLAGGFRLMTGHRLQDMGSAPRDSDFHDETLVVYMVRKHLAQLARDLIERGWPPVTPAAFVINATTRSQKVLTATLESLPDLVHGLDDAGPGLALIGATVALHSSLAPAAQAGPLDGVRLLVARARSGPSQVAEALRELGADVIEAPHLVSLPLPDPRKLNDAIQNCAAADIWAFGCDTSVKMFFKHLGRLAVDARDLPRRPVMAVGAGVQKALRRFGWKADIPLEGACASALAPWTTQLSGRSMALFTHSGGRPQLVSLLSSLGAHVAEVATYALRPQWPRIVAPQPRVLVIPSSSAAQYVFAGDLGFDLRKIPVVAIGPESAAAAGRLGARNVTVAPHDDIQSLIEITVEVVTQSQRSWVDHRKPQDRPKTRDRSSFPATLTQELP